MKLKINVWQRIMLGSIVGGVRGNVATMRKAMKVLDVLEMSDKEQKTVGLQASPDGNMRWNDTDVTYDLEIKDKEAVGLLKRLVAEYEEWPAGNASLVIDLADQLGIEEDDADGDS